MLAKRIKSEDRPLPRSAQRVEKVVNRADAAKSTVEATSNNDGGSLLQAAAQTGSSKVMGAISRKGATPIDFPLKKPSGVSDAAWKKKLDAMNAQAAQGKAKVVHNPIRDGKAQKQARAQGLIKKGHDADHGLDLQFGGDEKLKNIISTDSRVNRSVGAQGKARLNHPDGTPIRKFTSE